MPVAQINDSAVWIPYGEVSLRSLSLSLVIFMVYFKRTNTRSFFLSTAAKCLLLRDSRHPARQPLSSSDRQSILSCRSDPNSTGDSSSDSSIPGKQWSIESHRRRAIDGSTERAQVESMPRGSCRAHRVYLALSYVSHFDVLRQHVTRIFTSDTDALGGPGLTRTRVRARACTFARGAQRATSSALA